MQLGVSNQCAYGQGNHHAASFRAHGMDKGENGTGEGSSYVGEVQEKAGDLALGRP